jgi:hypothetical protein
MFLLFAAVLCAGEYPVPAEHQYLARLHIPDNFGAHRFNRAAFGRSYVNAAGGFAKAQRPEPVHIPCAD